MAGILVVDDSSESCEFLRTILEYEGHAVCQARDGLAALDVLRETAVDLVISDVLMPRMNGAELAGCMRDDPALARIPVIFFTATYLEREAQSLAEQCGVAWVLSKPSHVLSILRVVNEALGIPEAPLRSAGEVHDESAPDPIAATLVADGERYVSELRRAGELMSATIARGRTLSAEGAELQSIAARLPGLGGNVEATILRLTAALEVATRLSAASDLEAALDAALRGVQEACAARYGVAAVFDGSSGGYLALRTRGLADDEPLRRLDRRAGILGTLLDDAALRRIGPLPGPPGALGLPPFHPQVGAFVGQALRTARAGFGWIYVATKLGGDVFTALDAQLFAAIAAQTSIVVEHFAAPRDVSITQQ